MDMILNGGVPQGAMTLLAGGPGTGKTMMGLEFLYRGGLSGRPGVLLTFEEKDTALRRYAACFGWDLVDLEPEPERLIYGNLADTEALKNLILL
jgi:circadian clock protein KaiC